MRLFLGRRLNQSHALERLIRQLHVKSTTPCGWRESIAIAQVTDNEGLNVLRRQHTGNQTPEQLGTEATLMERFSTQVRSSTSGTLPLGRALRGQSKDIFKGYRYGHYTKLHFPLWLLLRRLLSLLERRGRLSNAVELQLSLWQHSPEAQTKATCGGLLSSAGCDDRRRTGRKPHPGWSPRHTHASIHHCRGDTKGPDANVTHASFLHHRTMTQTTYPHLPPQRVSKRLPRPQRASVTTFGFLLFTLLYF